jgi:hypothetical protein
VTNLLKFIDIDTDANLNKDKFKSTSSEFQQHSGLDFGMFHMFGGTRAPHIRGPHSPNLTY